MATIVASRFAVLSVDDDDDDLSSKKKKNSSKKPAIKSQNWTTVKSDGKKKKKQENAAHSQSKNVPKGNVNGNPKKKKQAGAESWDEWKQRETEYVEKNYEEDLSKALFLSKIEYEQKNLKKVDEEGKRNTKRNRKGQKAVSVEETKNLGSQTKSHKSLETQTEDQDPNLETSLLRLNINRQDVLSLISYKALIEKKDTEIARLKGEIEALNTQLKNVKTRNTKLCQVIANGEMKDKAEVLMEVERLQTIKDELSSEVANLHIHLEQERSKNRQLAAELKAKDKSKRHHASSEGQ